jgi:2-hydroxy-3-keto-5-methylthiopentenyl-1-phosphate phosphatase
MKNIKLVSDFDGIWTNQEAEAEFVWNYIIKKLSAITGKPESEMMDFLNMTKQEMNKEPFLYGWMNNGSTACFFGEDPFGDNNAIFDFIGRKYASSDNDDLTSRIKKIGKSILDSGYANFDKFANDCFFESTGKFKEEGKLNPCPEAKEVLETLFGMDVDAVVASNSKTLKIEHLFSKIGYKPTNEESPERGRLHARGNSMKFIIDKEFTVIPEFLNIDGNYKVPIRRKSYYKVLQEEKPDYVIGDVFSLDIALPLYLRLNDSEFFNLKVIQKIQKHTPGWVKEFLGRREFDGLAFMVENISEVPDVINKSA